MKTLRKRLILFLSTVFLFTGSSSLNKTPKRHAVAGGEIKK
jgi:hypothetical protein